jgi:hypothetical protein
MREVPVDPDAEQARDWLAEELAKTKYQERPEQEQGPSWIDEVLDAVTRFLNSLGGEQTVPFWVVLLVVVAVAVIIVAFLVFGVPKLRARSGVVDDDELFEADDHRDAAAMRRDADAAAKAGDWAEAIAERFRAIARSLHERALLSTLPGSTAHDVARRAAQSLPEHGAALERAAHDFDSVRYLGAAGDRERYARLVELDRTLERTRPLMVPVDDQVDHGGFARVEG